MPKSPKSAANMGWGRAVSVLIAVRTSHARAVRSIHGDRGGYCRFADRQWLPSPHPWSNTITGILKDNLLLIEYDVPL